MRTRSRAVRVYRTLLRLMPAAVRREDGEEMTRTFATLWAEAGRDRGRLTVLARMFGGLLGAIASEWGDRLRGSWTNRRSDRMDSLSRMFRFGLRSLRKSPAFTLTVVLLLGLGVGSVTTIFTLLDHVLLRPLPYPAAERLVELRNYHSGPTFDDVHEFRSVEMWAATRTLDANLTGAGRPQRLAKAEVTRDFLAMFGARPSAGRLLVADDFRTGEGVVLSHGTWQRVFGGDPAVIGRQIVLDGQPTVVVGVLEASFVPPEAHVGASIDVWGPLDPTAEWLSRRDNESLRVAGRLREGSTVAALAAEADALAQRRWREYPQQYFAVDCPPEVCPGGVKPILAASLQEATVGTVRKGLGLLFGAVTLLLLIACTNVAHLFMARGLARGREMAVRRALGARTWSLTAQLLLESLLVALGGGLLGVLLAYGGLHGLLALNAEALPRADAIHLDLRILGFALSVAVATGLVFGLLPGLRPTKVEAADVLQSRARGSSEGRRANRMRAGLIVAEVALSVVLVTASGLLLRSLARLHDQELGFRTEKVWTLPLSPAGIEASDEWVRRMERVRASLAGTPGVRAATYGISMPLEYVGGMRCCWNNRPSFSGVEMPVLLQMHPVDADYFDLLGVEIVAGAPWQRHEQDVRPVPAVLSEDVAVKAFGSAEEAVGREMRVASDEYRIAGVVKEHRYYGADQPALPLVYLPITTAWPTRAHMAVLVDGEDAGLADRLREAVWRAEPDLPVPVVRSLDDWNGAANARRRFESLLFTTFGVVALVLVAAGLYGTLLYAVGQRRRELGIRLALGDSPARLRRRVVWQGLRIAAIGCVVGTLGMLIFGRLLESRLYGVGTNDMLTMIGALGVIVAIAVVASWLPARRAAAMDPMAALRAE